jgi:CRP-like cAMP-binding protein
MSVEEAGCIDIICHDRAHEKIVLHITDHLGWDDENGHLLKLQDKLNAYLYFLKSGAVYEGHEELRGKKFVINVVFKNAPTSGALKFLEIVRPIVEQNGFELTHEIFKD